LAMPLFITMTWLNPAVATKAAADPITCSGNFGGSGGPDCANVLIGGSVISYPHLQWTTVAQVNGGNSAGFSNVSFMQGDQAKVLISRAAQQIGASSADLAKSVMQAPTNQPYLMGRYDPVSQTLHVDAYKLVKSGTNTVDLVHTNFTPYMGNQWAASRYFLPPSEVAGGSTPGINPFSTMEGGDVDFHNINVKGAMSVMGLAETFFRAPHALLAVLNPKLGSYTTSSGGWFRKTTTVHVTGQIIPDWYLIAPSGAISPTLQASLTPPFCATDPSATTSCPTGAIVPSTAAVYHMTGGTYDATPSNTLEVYRKSQSGFSFLGLTILLVIVSFGAAAVFLLAAAGAASAIGIAGLIASSITGTVFTSTLGAIAFEAGVIGGLAALAGNNGSGTYAFTLSGLYGDYTDQGAPGIGSLGVGYQFSGADAQNTQLANIATSAFQGVSQDTISNYQRAAALLAAPALSNPLTGTQNSLISGPYGGATPIVPPGITNTIVGGCSATVGDCGGANSGTLIRGTQYQRENMAQFVLY